MSLWSRIANVFRGDRLSREIDEELQSHIEEAIEQGRDPAEARRAFGSALRQREESRDIRLVAWLDSLRADAVFGWRQLMKKKVTSAAAILSLALAIGACTSAFRLIDALLLRPLAGGGRRSGCTPSPSKGIGVRRQAQRRTTVARIRMFRRMRAAVKDQAELIAVSYADRIDLTYGSDQEMEKAYLQYVSGWMFGTFGLQPALGPPVHRKRRSSRRARIPTPCSPTTIGRAASGGIRKVIGRTFRMGDDLYEIVGVAAERFTGTETGTVTDIFVPTMMNPAAGQLD